MIGKRKIIQVTTGRYTTALCNDGTLWQFNLKKQEWNQYPAIPRDETEDGYEKYLNACIEKLVWKERIQGLEEKEKKQLMKYIEERREYELAIRVL
ncbi:hypothetical protein BKK51_09225 [Rodentibacter trehalosifermentans]|uniref:Uncharacterized protein n=1 Tax=Rodentibacter trehalosifermentans TaxID=1908263 RepID=A0A1V3IPT7_9PAST|nr:hypothetical protein [Rodentibacter trehalosifermentans]OOF44275.1 hypothetical protein BKK51_09225 [Rodentibacter trehalosifermentans]